MIWVKRSIKIGQNDLCLAAAAVCQRALVIIPISLLLISLANVVFAQGLTGSIKGRVSATAGDPSAPRELLPGARLTLVNRDLPEKAFNAVTDETGNFSFLDLPAATYILTAEAGGLPRATRELRMTAGANLVVEIILTASVSESVTIKQEEGLLSAGETTISNTVRADKMEELPLRADNAQGALPLTPTVIRDASGGDHIKGTRAGQSSYTLNGADITDPVSGNPAFDIPLEAAANDHVEDNPYSAEFGKTTGGASNLETKTGGDKLKFGAARVFPIFHRIIGGKIDSFRPRLTFSGPIIRKRLNFVQSFEYRFSRTYVPSLAAPRDNSTAEAFNSFTQLDLNVNQRHTMKFVGALFPEKKRFVGLNTFNPQEATPNTKQRGELLSVSEQAIFHDESFLSSLLAYKTFSFDVFGQSRIPLTLAPEGNSGSYFADTRRTTHRWQWQEQYFARAREFHGQHSLKLGGEIDYTKLTGRFSFLPVIIRREDQTISERIDFTQPAAIEMRLAEYGGFVQDRWVLSKRLTFDAGVRIDRNTISRHNNIAPRFSFLFLPFHDDRTTIRGGIGLFYDRSPLSAKYFDAEPLDDDDELIGGNLGLSTQSRFPERIVTTYAADGTAIVDGPRLFRNVVRTPLRDAHSTRWSAQVDRSIAKHLTLRTGFVHRVTSDEPIIIPKLSARVLKTRGRSHYNEFELMAIYNSRRFSNWNLSYVWSKARGSLNTADLFLGDFPAFVIRPNQFGTLPFDVPHRFLGYGEVKAPWQITVMPALEIRSGFPFSRVDDHLNFVGVRNAQRFPTYLSVDATVLKGFKIPFVDKQARAGVIIFNNTNHFNPRDVQNNIASPHFGQFYNSLGTSVRGKFELDF